MHKYYFAAFIPEQEGGFHIVFPDVENAFTEADNLDEAMDMAADVLSLILRKMVQDNQAIPAPSGLEIVRERTAQYLRHIGHQADGEIHYQLIPAPSLDMVPVKLSISLPRAVLDEIDAKAKANGFTRSGFLAQAAQAWRPE